MEKRLQIVALFWCGAVLHCAAQPVILSQPQDQTAIQGATVRFSVEASGNGPLHYEWRDYSNFSTFRVLPGSDGPTVLVTNVQPVHRFGVVVTDDMGSVTSRLARVNLLLWFDSNPISQSVTQGQTALFSARAAGSNSFSFQWAFNRFLMPGETRTNLVLPN